MSVHLQEGKGWRSLLKVYACDHQWKVSKGTEGSLLLRNKKKTSANEASSRPSFPSSEMNAFDSQGGGFLIRVKKTDNQCKESPIIAPPCDEELVAGILETPLKEPRIHHVKHRPQCPDKYLQANQIILHRARLLAPLQKRKAKGRGWAGRAQNFGRRIHPMHSSSNRSRQHRTAYIRERIREDKKPASVDVDRSSGLTNVNISARREMER